MATNIHVRNKKKKKKCYMYNKITEDSWIEFVQYKEAEGKKLKDKIVTIEETLYFNKAWDTWSRIVKTAANKDYPERKDSEMFIEICKIIAGTDNPTHKLQTPNPFILNLWQPKNKKGTKQKWVLAGSDMYNKVLKSNKLEAIIVHWIEKMAN
ncbi:16442_t:CDS:2 [Gigaspora margarita]|uniref:16442_t:CDS:1 n=1 Tax=Gigaspora margarita TaxID=4874 RepID=A0ABM8W0I9_GIGMA|nr:16442_t:CDS:2 [Gigaspora margarita]